MRDLDIALVRSFVSVADSGSFTRAADRVHRTQSTISLQIRKLEEQLGQPLFLRTSRAVELTEQGEQVLAYARRLLALNDELCRVTTRPHSEPIRVGLSEDFAVEHFPSLLARFAADHPAARLEVRCDLSTRLEADFAAGDLDIALYKTRDRVSDAVADWPLHLEWMIGQRPVGLEDEIPLIAFPQGCIYRNCAAHGLESQGRPWRIVYSSPNHAGVLAALRVGLGITVLAPAFAPPDLLRLDAELDLPPLPDCTLVLRGSPKLRSAGTALMELLASSLETQIGSRLAA